MKIRTILPLLLLPAFFTLHRYLLYSGMVPGKEALWVAAELIGITLALFLLFRVWRKEMVVASLLATTLMAYHLFFGEIRSGIGQMNSLHELSRYRLFLPVSLVLLVFILRTIWKAKRPERLLNLINLVLVAWILIDLISARPFQGGRDKELYGMQGRPMRREQLKALPNGIVKPNFYFLVFDSHPSGEFLQAIGATDTVRLDEQLTQRGFTVAKGTRSNYQKTPFSISSTFNLGYLASVEAGLIPSAKAYTEALHDIDHALVPDWFTRSGYRFINLSSFRINGQEPLWKDDFLVLTPRGMLLHPTLFHSLRRDLLWMLFRTPTETDARAIQGSLQFKRYNRAVQDSLYGLLSDPGKQPRFVYSHLYLPHRPYFYDGNDREIAEDSALDLKAQANKQNFLGYLAYTDHWILKYVDAIRKQDPSAIILVQSDHGCRDLDIPLPPETRHMNYFALHLPGKSVKGLDGMTNINTFPLVLNELFGLDWPRLKDSLVITR